MKRKRIEDDEDQIRNLSLQWIAKKRAPREDEGRVSDIGCNHMSNRPSNFMQGRDFRVHYHAQNSGHTSCSNRGGVVTKSDPAILFSHKTRYPEDRDKEDDWISQMGAQYMSSRKVYEEYSSSSNYGGCCYEREHATRRKRELDDSWIADFGSQWMRSRSQMRDHHRGGVVTKSDPAILFSHKTRYLEDSDKEDAWISQLGAQYMSSKKVYGEYGSSSNYGGCYSEREHATRRNWELDDSWIADFGSQWKRSRSQMRDHHLSSIRNVRDESWISELGYEWMSSSKGRDSLTLTKSRLPDLSSQYTNRRNVHEDEWFSGLQSTYRSQQRNLIKDSLVAELGSHWETRRKLDYRGSGSGISAYHTTDVEFMQQHGVKSVLEDKTGHGYEVAVVAEPSKSNDKNSHRFEVAVVDEHASGDKNGFVEEVSSGMEHVPQDKDKVDAFDELQVLESSPFEDEFPASYVNLESPAHSP